MSAYFTNSLTPPTGFDLLTSLRGGFSHRSGSAWPGRSQKDGLPSARGESKSAVQGHQLALEGQPSRCPFLIGAGMDAKTRDLALLTAYVYAVFFYRRRHSTGDVV